MLDFDKLLAPISGDNPSGKDVRYELTYDQIKEARRSDDTLSRGDWQREVKTSDWKTVKELATTTLIKESKDLQIAGWLTEALTWLHGFAGLKDGLHLIRELLNQFWETVYPEIEDDDLDYRVSPLEWLDNTFAVTIKQIPINEQSDHLLNLFDHDRVVRIENLKAQDKNAFAELSEDEKTLPETFAKMISDTPRAPLEEQSGELKQCLQELELLEETVDEKFDKAAPGFSAMRNALEERLNFCEAILKKKPKPAPEPEPEKTETAAAAEKPPPPSASVEKTEASASEPVTETKDKVENIQEQATPAEATDIAEEPVEVETEVEATKEPSPAPPEENSGQAAPSQATPSPTDNDTALQHVLDLAAALRQSNRNSPIPYLIARAVRWGELRQQGNHLDSSHLKAPSKQTRQHLKKLFDEGPKSKLLDQSEETMMGEEGRAWLDLQFYTYSALSALGAGSKHIKDALRAELRTFLADFEDLPFMELSDGTPAAGPETQKWLREEVLSQKNERTMQGSDGGVEGIADEILTKASAKVKAGQFSEGLALLQTEVRKTQSEREKFLGKLMIAELCLSADRFALAKPVLKELIEFIDKFRLEEWEAKSVNVRVWKAFIRCFRGLDNLNETEKEQLNRAFDKLCQLDIEQALALDEA